jgi:hypothetical protein
VVKRRYRARRPTGVEYSHQWAGANIHLHCRSGGGTSFIFMRWCVGTARPDLARINKQYNTQTTLFFQHHVSIPRVAFLRSHCMLPYFSICERPGLYIAQTSTCRVSVPSFFSVWVLKCFEARGAETAVENSLTLVSHSDHVSASPIQSNCNFHGTTSPLLIAAHLESAWKEAKYYYLRTYVPPGHSIRSMRLCGSLGPL